MKPFAATIALALAASIGIAGNPPLPAFSTPELPPVPPARLSVVPAAPAYSVPIVRSTPQTWLHHTITWEPEEYTATRYVPKVSTKTVTAPATTVDCVPVAPVVAAVPLAPTFEPAPNRCLLSRLRDGGGCRLLEILKNRRGMRK